MPIRATAEPSALLKILSHAAKFPSASINGVLLGTLGQEPGDVHITDVIPLGHTALGLAPAVEVALPLIELYAEDAGAGLQMVGYYHSDARFQAGDLPPVGRRIADRISDKHPASVVLLLDNKRLGAFCASAGASSSTSSISSEKATATAIMTPKVDVESPFELFVKDGTKGWRRGGADGAAGASTCSVADGGSFQSVREEFFAIFRAQKHRELFDFDDHLDDVRKDFLNRGFLKPPSQMRLPGQGL